MSKSILNMELRLEHDVVLARQRGRQIAGLLGFDAHDQTRIATAVSEIARNAFRYAQGGRVEFAVTDEKPPVFEIAVRDNGPGIKDLQTILDGRYRSTTGMGLGIIGVRRLMDNFTIVSNSHSGTSVVLGKALPRRVAAITAQQFARVAEELARRPAQNPLEEIQQQNQELLEAFQQLQDRQTQLQKQKEELAHLNRELEDTNRGVVALYSELDEKADYLRRASETKSRFLSNMSHEFRTPLNSLIGLSRLLIERTDGELSGEQEKQVAFIKKAAEDLTELVNDLLDLAKVEAGKVLIRSQPFDVGALFGALRGMLRPLLAHNSSITLNFVNPIDLPRLETDEGKVSQILRNLISNALKFTERGEIRITAASNDDGTTTFSVADPGIGIAVGDQERIFQEYTQVEGDRQKRVKGTGLGLPLSRKLAELLGGHLSVSSEVGIGSTFSLNIPSIYKGAAEMSFIPEVFARPDPTRFPILIVEDNRETLFIYEKFLKGTGFQVIPARTLAVARQAINEFRPVAIVLDVLLESESTWELLIELKSTASTKNIPVLVVTMVENQHKALALGADDFATKPVERNWLLDRLRNLAVLPSDETALIIDDDEVSRYLLKGLLAETRYSIIEAKTGVEGIALAQRERPRLIFLDLEMPDVSGFHVLDVLKGGESTRNIPVIVNTAKVLDEGDRKQLNSRAAAILSKSTSSREAALTGLRTAIRQAGIK
jgi:signal transduction histidine kinase/CheY-like chemotaxis protein